MKNNLFLPFTINPKFQKSIKRLKADCYDILEFLKEVHEAEKNNDFEFLKSMHVEILRKIDNGVVKRIRYKKNEYRIQYCKYNDNNICFWGFYSNSKHDISIDEANRCNYSLLGVRIPIATNNLINLVTENLIPKLDEKQEKVLESIKKKLSVPTFVFGTAGSGKTTIALESILDNYDKVNDIGYFTYTKKLQRHAYKVLSNYIDQKNLSCDKNVDSKITLHSLEDDLKDNNIFEKWYEKCKLPQKEKVDKNVLFYEFKSLIKGNELNESEFLNNTEYKENSNLIYIMYNNYSKFLKDNNLNDSNDFAKNFNFKKRYDLIIVDEVQDINYLEFKYILSHLKEKTQCVLCGDIHQSINNLYFKDVTLPKIKQYFFEQKFSFNEEILNDNYRNSSIIVSFLNSLRKIRENNIGFYKQKTEQNEISKRDFDDIDPQITFVEDDYFLKNICDYDIDFAIVTYDKNDKEYLCKFLGEKYRDIIYTIFDIKGLEFDNIVAYNLYDKCNIDNVLQKDIAKHNTKLRHDFNRFFVAFSRAKNSICLINKKNYHDLWINLIKEHEIKLIKLPSIDELGFKKYLPEELKKIYIEKELNSIDDINELKRCRAFYIRRNYNVDIERIDLKINNINDLDKCSELLIKNGYYEHAREYFLHLNNMLGVIAIDFILGNKSLYEKEKKEFNYSDEDVFNSKYGIYILEELIMVANDIVNLNEKIRRIYE